MAALFGDYLRQLMQRKGELKAAELARHILVDGAQVRRWLHNQATPKLNSDYLARIAAYLDLTEIERSRLEEAQIHSLRVSAASRLGASRAVRPRGNPAQLLSRYEHAPSGSSHTRPTTQPAQPIRRAPGTAIRDPDRVVAEAIKLLHATWELATPHERTIYLSFQSAQSIFEASSFYRDWQHALRVALDRGWDVCHLLRLDRNAQRSLDLVEEMFVYLGAPGTYRPYYFNRYGTVPSPSDFLIVPTLGALIFLTTTQDQRADSAIWLRDEKALDLLLAHFRQLRANSSTLFTSYSQREDLPAFFDAHAEMELRAGDRYLFKDGLSDITRPATFYQPAADWLRVASVPGEPTERTIERWNMRFEAFEGHIRSYTYWDLHPKRAIQQLLCEGRYARDYRHIPVDFALDAAQCRDHVNNVIRLLKTYDNYHVAFLDTHEERDLFRTFWQIMGDHTVLLEAGTEGKHEGLLTITEGTIARAFQAHAQDAWERLAPHHHDKYGYTIPWLEAEVRRAPRIASQQRPSGLS